MTRVLLAVASGLLAIAVPHVASAQAGDPRLVDHLYNPDEVLRIEGKVNVQTTIKFGEDEHIENVAIGDSQSWQVTPNKRANLLFVKPLAVNAFTNMTVVTDRRTYFFDLVATPKAQPLYVIDFEYGPEQQDNQESAQAEKANPLEMAAAKDPYAIVNPAALNFDWVPKGDRKLLPARVYDDGEATFLSWPAGTPIPAILVKDREGTEGPVNFAVHGDIIVIDGVPAEIVLRSGRDDAALNKRTSNDRKSRPSAFARTEEVKR